MLTAILDFLGPQPLVNADGSDDEFFSSFARAVEHAEAFVDLADLVDDLITD